MELSGGISRLQDFANIRQAEDSKVMTDQTVFADHFRKEIKDKNETVKRGNDTDNNQKRFDAKEKGSNEYYGDGGKKRNGGEEKNKDGQVRVKSVGSTFDIRI